MLIRQKVNYFSAGNAEKQYHVRVDPLPSRYAKADEAAHKIINNTLKNELGMAAVETLITRDSKKTAGIQLADLLLGAVMAAFQEDVQASPKLTVMKIIADHLGWPDLKADTHLTEWKFNIWCFHDPTTGLPREVTTRDVKHLIPTPLFRPRRRRR